MGTSLCRLCRLCLTSLVCGLNLMWMPAHCFPQDVMTTITLIGGYSWRWRSQRLWCEARLPVSSLAAVALLGRICSQAAGVEALRVGLELALFPSGVCFSFCPHWNLCPEGGECCSKQGLCAYTCPVCCLCRYLQSRPEPDQGCLFPCCGGLSSSVRLWQGVGALERLLGGHGIVVAGVEVAALSSEVWATSVALSEHQQWPSLILYHAPGPWVTSVSLDRVFFQDVAALESVPSCGVE